VTGRASLLGGNRILLSGRRLGAEALVAAPLVRNATRSVTRLKPDAVVVIKGRFVPSGMVERLRAELGAPIVNYYPDDPFWPEFGDEPVVRALRSYDLVCVWSRSLEERLRHADVRQTMVLPFAYDPSDYPGRPDGHPYSYDAAFVGQWQPVREEFLNALADLKLVISGRGWARATRGKPLSRHVVAGDHFGHRAAEIYWSSKIGINILHGQNVRVSGHNMRSWELPATRTPTVATRTVCHEQMYGESAVLVSSPQELSARVRELLVNDERRAFLGAAGAKAVKHGTYRARARSLVSAIEDLRSRLGT